jgi:FdrA protein
VLAGLTKPVVACLLGESLPSEGAVEYVGTLGEAADAIARRLGVHPPAPPQVVPRVPSPRAGDTVYGLFAGGTLCSEAARTLDSRDVRSHLLDLGDDEYTRGRAHPIIDPRLRNAMLVDLAGRNNLGAVLIDVILGDLAHPDPAGALAPAIEELRRRGSDVPVVAVVIGTRGDPQDLHRQQAILGNLGVTVCDRVSTAADLAAMMVGSAAV